MKRTTPTASGGGGGGRRFACSMCAMANWLDRPVGLTEWLADKHGSAGLKQLVCARKLDL